jgi:hypothetical protein
MKRQRRTARWQSFLRKLELSKKKSAAFPKARRGSNSVRRCREPSLSRH